MKAAQGTERGRMLAGRRGSSAAGVHQRDRHDRAATRRTRRSKRQALRDSRRWE
jgi:hypothetical protein